MTNPLTLTHIGAEKRRAHILVVDDHPINIRVVHQILSEHYAMFAVTTGEQALAFCNTTPPDMILLDVMMPGMDGLEVCRRLKLQLATESIPVIFVTSHQNSDDETACWEAGGTDFINKPVNPSTLRNRVNAHLVMKFQADILRGMAFRDGLTNISNRRHFDERFGSEWKRCHRSNAALSLLLIDIDFFKKYNDLYGHLMGDDCLRIVAETIKTSLKRPFDLAARFGGEEFVCLLPETSLNGAIATGKVIETAIRSLSIPHQNSDCADVITVSVGVAMCYPNQTSDSDSLLHMADIQLYRAKQQGRGRICAASESECKYCSKVVE